MLDTTCKKLAVLISGRGSNMEAILRASQAPDYPAEISIVIADSQNAEGLETAALKGIDTAAFERKAYGSKAEHETAVMSAIETSGADIVVLAGYMRILSEQFVEAFAGRLLNIHPSLLPAYKGLDTHERAIADGAEKHGCTVHFVNAEMDGGQIIAQEGLEILPDDTPNSLAARILKIEHKIYPAVIALVASDQVKLVDDVLSIDESIERKTDGSLRLLF